MSLFQKNNSVLWYKVELNLVEQDTLLLSSAFWDKSQWQKLRAGLSKSTAYEGRWAEIELSGTGRSKPSLKDKSQLRPSAQAEEALAFLDVADLTDITLVAHSFAAPVALSCALQRPEIFKKLVLISPFANKNFEMSIQTQKKLKQLKTGEGVEALGASDELKQSLKSTPDLIWDELGPHLSDSLLFSRLTQIQIPVKILHGTNDSFFSKEDSKKMAQRWPQGQFIECRNSGHFAQLDQPEEVLRAIRE